MISVCSTISVRPSLTRWRLLKIVCKRKQTHQFKTTANPINNCNKVLHRFPSTLMGRTVPDQGDVAQRRTLRTNENPLENATENPLEYATEKSISQVLMSGVQSLPLVFKSSIWQESPDPGILPLPCAGSGSPSSPSPPHAAPSLACKKDYNL